MRTLIDALARSHAPIDVGLIALRLCRSSRLALGQPLEHAANRCGLAPAQMLALLAIDYDELDVGTAQGLVDSLPAEASASLEGSASCPPRIRRSSAAM